MLEAEGGNWGNDIPYRCKMKYFGRIHTLVAGTFGAGRAGHSVYEPWGQCPSPFLFLEGI